MRALFFVQRLGGSIRKHGGLVLYFSVLAASLCLNVALAWRVKDLSRFVPASARPAGLSAGERVPPVPIVSRAGAKGTLSFDASTLLYIFSPECEWCGKNHANLLALYRAHGQTVRFVAVTADARGLDDFLTRYPMPFEVFLVDRSRVVAPFKVQFALTPQTVAVAKGGLVERAFVGALFGERKQEAERFFHTVLPGAPQ